MKTENDIASGAELLEQPGDGNRKVDALVRLCENHHCACDCRESLMRDLLLDVMQTHADPNDANYNECDTDPCQWCENALKLIGSNVPHDSCGN